QMSALVSAQWLWRAIQDPGSRPNLHILDASWYLPEMNRDAKKEFRHPGHIPGASLFDIDACSDRRSPFDHMLPTESEFTAYVGKLGIGNDAHVVVYDASDFGAFSAPRVWWMFRVFGHRAVSLLDGGLVNWIREGYPVTGEHSEPKPVTFVAKLEASRVKSYEDILENLEQRAFQLLDVKTPGRFRGIEPEPMEGVEPGHIPGSVNIPFYDFLTPPGFFKPPSQIQELFGGKGLDLSQPLAVTCGSGVTACHAVLAAAALCGKDDVAVYDGSWGEWFRRAPPELILSEGE
ncbi:THTM sulfurtransferase, partial [Atractosteus spatula]|nr:THTM sulfurtransferase [Atractosteus spatula]